MLRLALLVAVWMANIGTALAADMPDGSRRYRSPPKTDDTPDQLFTPSEEVTIPIPHALFGGPLLLGSSSLPGIYGSRNSYDYQGPYYGGSDFHMRLPYACGVYGYC
jgi:hypothetical protein